ncbi:MAG TPA: alpha/beta hydrolase [Acidimicrobiales bacterium]|nr:alpha/beta hydrolase [Acidimicrobiales bacterium]
MSIQLTEVDAGSYRFVLRTAGPEDGEPVLLLHGFPQTSHSWRHQLEALAAAGYRAVAPDQRGYSPGARPEAVEDYRISLLVSDVVGIADALGFDTFHLVGHDWGAGVAWQVAGNHQARLRTLTILSVPHPRAFGRAIQGDGGADQAERSSYMQTFRQEGSEDLFVKDGAAGLRAMYASSGLTDVEPYVAVLADRAAMRAALNWYRAAGIDSARELGEITMPTLFIWSTNDPALGPDAARWTEEYVVGPYRFEILEGVSHWIAEEAPDRTNELLLEHLTSA